jgi:hypothetical protein
MGAVGYFAAFTRVGFLWHNAIGTITVVAVGVLVSAVSGKSSHEGHEGHEGS